MITKEAFPQLFLINNTLNPIWELDLSKVDLFDLNEIIGITLEKQSTKSPEFFKLTARKILEDIFNSKSKANNAEVLLLDFLQFIHCTEAGRYFSTRGMFIECHDWLIYSISDELEHDIEAEFQRGRINNFLNSDNSFISRNAISSTLEWAEILFYYSRHHGGLVKLTLIVFNFVSKIILSLFTNGIPIFIDPIILIITTSQALAWTINYYPELSKPLAENLGDYFEKANDRKERKNIAVQLSLGGAEFTNRSSSEWLGIVIEQYSDLIIGHERLQLLAKYYLINIDKLNSDWEQFKLAIKEYLQAIKSLNPIYLKYEKARIFSVIRGLLAACVEKGRIEVANNILIEFYEVDKVSQISHQQLYVICNYNPGPLYVSSKNRTVSNAVTTENFVELIYKANKFLNSKISLNDYPDFKLYEPELIGKPIIEEGFLFEELLAKHYQLNMLSNLKLEEFDSMIIIPGFQHPIQSLMVKTLDSTLPICVSFEKSLPKRKINKVLLWCFGTTTSELEIALTKQMFESVGINVEAIDILNVKKEDFISKYKSNEYDLIWVGSHGNYNHYSPHLSNIDLHPDGVTELSEIFGLTPETDGQRMLFLNICDGATASTLNSVYDIGLGATLCGRTQSVLSHIWMVKIESSFIYGVLYAHFLICEDDFFTAYENVVKAFLKGKEHIRKLLLPYAKFENDLLKYIDSLDDNINENIYYWGSGVYYQ